jgi:hypothetical protein
MSYEITGFTYDYERHLPGTGVTVKALTTTNQVLKSQFNPVPYNLGFNLSIMSKTIEDGLMIIEQILPFFAPDYTVTILDMPELDLTKDIPIVFNGISPEDNYDGTFQEKRTIIFTLNFTAKAYLYPPVKLQKINIETDINVIAEPGTVPNSNNIKVLVSPSSATLTAGSQRQLLLSLINTTGVTWTLSPNVGTVSASGVYTAPSVIASASQVAVRATSVVDPAQFSESVITLTP